MSRPEPTQQPLFPDDRYQPPVRLTDPPESRLGYEHIRPKLNNLEQSMLIAFGKRPMTSNEAARWCINRWGGANMESYRKTTHLLKRKHLIDKVDSRACSVTGRTAGVFKARGA